VEGLLAAVGLEVTTDGIRTGTGTERQRERVPERRLVAPLLLGAGVQQLIDRYHSLATCAQRHAAVDKWERQTDGHRTVT